MALFAEKGASPVFRSAVGGAWLTRLPSSGRRLGLAQHTKLFNEEIHVVARAGITSLQQLQGQKVNRDVDVPGWTRFERVENG